MNTNICLMTMHRNKIIINEYIIIMPKSEIIGHKYNNNVET